MARRSDVDYDVVVIGSGFGGSVSALRLTEKGYRVGVLEMGRRFADDELPRTSWDVRRFLWAPWARCFGIMRITLLKDVLIASGAGVGGGSLVYANTLYEPLDGFFTDRQWSRITDWRDELAPHYRQAKRMLGVTTWRGRSPADELIEESAAAAGATGTLHPADVGVLFGDRKGMPAGDPFFGGVGPERTTCTECGACMTGCRVGAKNTLVKNYLYLAERHGAVVHPLTTVTDVRPGPDGYVIRARSTGNPLRRKTFTAREVVFAGNALNTQNLLHRLRRRSLPRLSGRVGELSRTNSEAVLGARSFESDRDVTPGVAITSSFHPDDHTHVEFVRYGKGSGALSLMNAPLIDPEPGVGTLRAILRAYRELGVRDAWRLHDPRRWAEQTVVVLVMQALDNSITTSLRRGPFGRRMTSRQGEGEPNPSWIPVANAVTRELADRIGGAAGGSTAGMFGVPLTAHFIGGCVIAEGPDEGVIDPYQRVFGYPGLHIADGSAITANPGVNPSLTITAQAERAMSFWPNRGDQDPRPALGAGYRRIEAVAAMRPAVPSDAPGALFLPPPTVRG